MMGLARFERPLPRQDAAAAVRVKWMREGARLMVRLIALDATLVPRADHSPYVEALGYLQCFGLRCRASNAEIISATQAEWRAATDYCARFIEVLRRTIWARCKARQPESVIIAAAEDVAILWDMPISDDQLYPLLRRVWSATSPRRRYVR